jgi:hypothetical protein
MILHYICIPLISAARWNMKLRRVWRYQKGNQKKNRQHNGQKKKLTISFTKAHSLRKVSYFDWRLKFDNIYICRTQNCIDMSVTGDHTVAPEENIKMGSANNDGHHSVIKTIIVLILVVFRA